ncbi:hypothetical protein B0I35DRAFT_488488, partial [Stachybotrys elegans]
MSHQGDPRRARPNPPPRISNALTLRTTSNNDFVITGPATGQQTNLVSVVTVNGETRTIFRGDDDTGHFASLVTRGGAPRDTPIEGIMRLATNHATRRRMLRDAHLLDEFEARHEQASRRVVELDDEGREIEPEHEPGPDRQSRTLNPRRRAEKKNRHRSRSRETYRSRSRDTPVPLAGAVLAAEPAQIAPDELLRPLAEPRVRLDEASLLIETALSAPDEPALLASDEPRPLLVEAAMPAPAEPVPSAPDESRPLLVEALPAPAEPALPAPDESIPLLVEAALLAPAEPLRLPAPAEPLRLLAPDEPPRLLAEPRPPLAPRGRRGQKAPRKAPEEPPRTFGDYAVARNNWVAEDTRTCGVCNRRGHMVEDCVDCSDDGLLHGCPICNAAHDLGSCQEYINANDERKLEILVDNRENMPPLFISEETTWHEYVYGRVHQGYTF